jgi:hypothetical protein
MHPSTVKHKLAANEPVLAAKVNFMSPQIVEMLAGILEMLGWRLTVVLRGTYSPDAIPAFPESQPIRSGRKR